MFYHLIGAYSAADNMIRRYVNSTEVAAVPGQEGSVYVSDAKVFIGASLYGSVDSHFDGLIDDVAIYDRVLAGTDNCPTSENPL